MGDFLILERFKWFDHQVRNNRFPNAATLAGHFEIAPKTAQRTIDFLRDRFAAPLEYNATRRGYCYPELLSRTFSRRPRESWQPLLEETFGIFQGADPIQITLQFTPFRARWIREQLWRPSQKITNLADGSLELSFPVADFRELKMKILQFGADVKVIKPEALKVEIHEEIKKMTTLYEL